MSEKISIKAAVIAFFSVSKATYYAVLQLYVLLLLLVISNKISDIREVVDKPLIKISKF